MKTPFRMLTLLGAALVMSAPLANGATTIVPVDEDVMTSGFFQGTDTVRGYDADNRDVHRVSTPNPFGVFDETVYLTFDFDFVGFGGPVAQAILRVDSQSGGFGADATIADPFLVSAHGVNADPLTSITDNTNPTGPISYTDFFANNILAADAAAMTSVTGFGTLEFDVTALVNDWIAGSNTVFAIALTGQNDVSGIDFLHGITNNSESAGISHSIAMVVPEPGSLMLGCLAGLGALVMSRRNRHLA